MFTIYVLVDPRNGCAYYVGATGRPLIKRWRTHVADARSSGSKAARRTRAILDTMSVPEIVAIEQVAGTVADALRVEAEWLAHLRASGAELTNVRDGGFGCYRGKAAA